MFFGMRKVTAIAAAALCVIAVTSSAARAALIYESATGDFDAVVGGGTGVNANQYIGAAFSLNQQSTIDAIGGHFGTFSGAGGSLFGALVALNSSGFPSSTGLSFDTVIASTVFTPTLGSDFLTPLSTVLNAGTYGVVFGSNMFGAAGSHTLTLLQTPTITSTGTVFISNTSSFISWGNLSAPSPNRLRLLVSAESAVPLPLPAALPLFLSGLVGLGLVLRGRSKLV
ncbi:MAG: hypothetical protein HN478_13195 [Rhodospirillaceae bacterium]|jgi:hypothetical protein|nr:hypothetical protein [Rhodospirillaceae bacterium]MBT5050305.1 hypothetical protein [Rhodospirillaceae bacterium]MBT5458186.1 hypothetical protein [Rhodospirillaceae bacterium]